MSVAMMAVGLYSARQFLTFKGLLTRILVAAGGGAVVVALVSCFVPALSIGPGELALGILLTVGGSIACHIVLDKLASENAFKARVVVYGAGRNAASLLQLSPRIDQRGFSISGFIPSVADEPSAVSTERRVALQTTLLEYCRSHAITEIVVAMDDSRSGFPFLAFLECRLAGIKVTDLTMFLERETGKVRIDLLQPSWMIYSEGFSRNSLQLNLERAFDLFASLTLFILMLPVMAMTVLAIKLEEGPGASILYRQVRVGQGGRHFQLLKFRSMREDAERDGHARWASANDDRITRVGRIIRKLRIDELPQILNVLQGEMSLVGPRPERPEFVNQLSAKIPFYRERHTIKPGITGWAQVCYPYGANELDAAEKLQYDLFYVKNRSVLFYLAILLQTVEVVLWGKGSR
jgi:sugar transferase (PEP-CTERM system associated)